MSASDVLRLVSQVRRVVRRDGMVPVTDPAVPSLVSIVVGSPVAGSWWGHPAGALIYQVGEALENDRDILSVKLWRGKVTLVHRRLWPALLRVVTAREGWQIEGLGAVPRQLLGHIDRIGLIRSDRLPDDYREGVQGFRPALRQLERRLLVLTCSVHTETGAHALAGESWHVWAKRARAPRFSGPVASAQQVLEAAAARLSPGVRPDAVLPWKAMSRSSASVH